MYSRWATGAPAPHLCPSILAGHTRRVFTTDAYFLPRIHHDSDTGCFCVSQGEVQILSTDMLYDCGQSLSPEIDIGQVEGAFMIGVGHFLTEGLEYDTATGALATFDTWEYKPPQSLDIPISW
jgi:hypothetical protein